MATCIRKPAYRLEWAERTVCLPFNSTKSSTAVFHDPHGQGVSFLPGCVTTYEDQSLVGMERVTSGRYEPGSGDESRRGAANPRQ